MNLIIFVKYKRMVCFTNVAIAAGTALAFSFLFYGTEPLHYTTANQPRATPGLVEKNPARVTAAQ